MEQNIQHCMSPENERAAEEEKKREALIAALMGDGDISGLV